MDTEELIRTALEYRRRAYAPVSKFKVGAALLTKQGKIYGGCNIEDAAFSPSVCAERTAFYKAISEGEHEFEAIAIVGGPEDEETPKVECPPCGVCRQVMSEFCDGEFLIILAYDQKSYSIHTLEELLPLRFSKTLL